ncbi:TetR family transcriptional regulator C-terminal domain-containing protein [Hyunsoonleella sp. SJ7]|uniref:TetR family transcriptional regulator C-terminal domain-containing protein n=1 Tax=Hyunsoonleella aquatilis TaxID=2762758 RepID=A0A923HKJ0_9FLAO|nr:TetR/AcrR family transcriptional regulator [Hyunsoonleella aquatilis]MBC3760007.1 TetR family transcriptional regulator C-terminal domain-containing protein [Hyunsoonleella aquatilis]
MKKEIVESILEKGTDLILKNGYHNIGLNKILKEANIPKGSFYYYFKSKEDFGLQIIKFYSEKSLVVLRSYLEDGTKNHKQRIISFFRDMQDIYIVKEYKEGCLLGNCSTELSDFSESFSISIANELSVWEKCFENCIQEGQIEGNIKISESPKILSDLILTMWEGALLRMKSAKNVESIETFILYLEKYIL